MTIVLLALGAGATFGAMTVAVRVGLQRLPDAHGATFAVLASALLVVGVGALVRHDIAGSWRFFLAGLIAPGLSQLLFTRAVAEVGASRASAAVGSGPLYALALAFVFLGEPVRIGLVLGGLAIVAGGVLLAAERQRPAHLRARGLVYGLGCAVCFAVRDNLVRALHAHGNPETAATATILAGLLVAAVATRRLPSRQQFSVLAPAGVLFGLSYELLFEAYFHGRVSIVSPLVASETLWAFVLAAVFLRQSEDMGLRLVLGATAILAGGVVIGIAAVS